MLNEEKSRFLSGKNILTVTIFTIGLITSLNAQGITNTLGGNTYAEKFIVENSDAEAGLVVTGAGNVGIGNTEPSTELHLKGNGEIIRMESTSLNNGYFSIFNSDGYKGYLGSWNGPDDIDVGTGSGNTTGKLHLVTHANPKLTVTPDGNIGIGTVTPSAKLHVYGKAIIREGGAGLVIIPENNSVALAYTEEAGSFVNMRLQWAETTFQGKVGVDNSSPTHLLDVGNSGAYCDGGAWVDGSSRKFKENITQLALQEAMETLIQLDPVKYNYISNTTEDYIGFIAEDVPELIATNDRKGLSPMDIVAVLTKVTQEQQKVIENLSGRIEELENR